MFARAISSIGLMTVLAGSAFAQTANFGALGYTESFDSMGTAGTAAPTGWRHFLASFGSNSTWTSSIPASGTNSMASVAVTQAATTLAATTTPSGTSSTGFNAAASAGSTGDRVLATSPTGIAGAILQLALNNSTGASLPAGSALTIGFDTIRYTQVSSANQLPGYWLFVSFDAATWTNVATAASPNPDITSVPNTVGTTARSVDLVLPSDWIAGSTIHFRWVDDNAQQTSPDQIIGLNNVSIVPTPASALLVALGALGVARRRR